MKAKTTIDILLGNVQMVSCSVLPRKALRRAKHRRHPVVVFGIYPNRKDLTAALHAALGDEGEEKIYDLRTVRTHDCVQVSLTSDATRVVSLENLYEETRLA